MYYLYPRISKPSAVQLAGLRAGLDIETLVEFSLEIDHPELWYAPTSGNRVDVDWLQEFQQQIRRLAGDYGYPSPIINKASGDFDKRFAEVLYETMNLYPVEASSLEIWMYITTILLPDLVRWRFMNSGNPTSIERFIGSARGLRRNMFGRMWWRAHLFYYPQNSDDPYLLLGLLSEDDQIQISERPSLSGNPRLAKEVAIAYLTAQQLIQRNRLEIEKRMILRDALKRISRILPITMLDMLEEEESQAVFDGIFQQSIEFLTQ